MSRGLSQGPPRPSSAALLSPAECKETAEVSGGALSDVTENVPRA